MNPKISKTHKNQVLHLCNIPSCKIEKNMVFYSHKERGGSDEDVSSRFKSQSPNRFKKEKTILRIFRSEINTPPVLQKRKSFASEIRNANQNRDGRINGKRNRISRTGKTLNRLYNKGEGDLFSHIKISGRKQFGSP